MPFDQKQYIGSYNKNNYKMFPFRVKRKDTAIIEKLKSVPSMNQYIITLIENDIYPSVLTIKQIKDKMLPIMAKHQIKEVYLFGSYSRGEAKNNSDVDIYCSSGDIKTLLDQGYLEEELKKALGKEVDIVFIGSQMNDFFRQQLEGDKIRLC